MNQFIKSAGLAAILAAGAVAATANAGPVFDDHHHRDFDDKGVRVTPSVPEASTLSLMAVGLGLIGLRLRRKNK